MKRRQSLPEQWLILDSGLAEAAVRRLPPGSGVLVLGDLRAGSWRRLRALARGRGLTVVREGRPASRVHNVRELRRALLRRTPLVLLSPLFPTRSHPEWAPIPPMRAAALARLGKRRLLALGGMDARKFARVRGLGFQGWAGISAWSPSLRAGRD
jgi:thiamine-phosphate pyrophosphorylase